MPDIKPSFIYKRHEITETFPDLKKQMEVLATPVEGEKEKVIRNIIGIWEKYRITLRIILLIRTTKNLLVDSENIVPMRKI